MADQRTVYIYLLDEGVDVCRPVVADHVSNALFRLGGPVPEGESWQFQPGDLVRCEERVLSAGSALVAIEKSLT